MMERELTSSEVLDRLHDRPDTALFVAFTCAPKHLRNAFTGVNQRRRREDRMTWEFAQWIAASIDHIYGIYRDTELLTVSNIGEMIYKFLLAVPDALAKMAGSKVEAESHQTRQQIVTELLAAITVDCRFVQAPKAQR